MAQQVASTRRLRKVWPRIKRGSKEELGLAIVEFNGAGKVKVAPRTAEAWRALNALFVAFGYITRSGDTYGHSDRAITGGVLRSLHALGIAADINFASGPYRKRKRSQRYRGPRYGEAAAKYLDRSGFPPGTITDWSPAMAAAACRIKTNDGFYIFRLGHLYGSIMDAMHVEIIVDPTSIATGIDWTTVAGDRPVPGTDKTSQAQTVAPFDADNPPTMRRGSRSPQVLILQRELIADGYDVPLDGAFGDEDDAAIRTFQQAEGLTVDGIVGRNTWAKLLDDGLATDDIGDPDTRTIVSLDIVLGAALDTDKGAWQLLADGGVMGLPYVGGLNVHPEYRKAQHGLPSGLEAPRKSDARSTHFVITTTKGGRFPFGK